MARLLAPVSTLLPLLLLGLATAAPQLRVKDDFLDLAQASELAARVRPRGALDPFSQPVDVPASLYARLVSAFAPAGAAAAATVTAGAAAELVVIPGRSERGHVKAHEDHWAGLGKPAHTTVGLVYLAGDGQLAFTHRATGEETVVDVKPGRLLAWDNAAYTHSLVAGASERALLGPMAWKNGAFHEVGMAGWGTYGQLGLNSLLPKQGSLLKATTTVVPEEWLDNGSWSISNDVSSKASVGNLVITLSHDAAADQVTHLKASLQGYKGIPRVQPTVAGNTASFAIPGDKVQTMKDLKLSYSYRLAKSMPVGTKIRFQLAAGTVNQQVTVAVKGRA